MKYKLINTKTKEEHLCDKVIIDGFEYYVDYSQPIEVGKWYISNQAPRLCVKIKDGKYPYVNLNSKREEIADFHTWNGVIICCNNPTIDIPQVIDQVEKLAVEITDYAYFSDSSIDYASYYKGVKTGYNKSQETHSNSDEDMVDFYEWCDTSEEAAIFWRRNKVDPDMSGNYWKKIRENREKLLQLWKEQQPKIIYYNE